MSPAGAAFGICNAAVYSSIKGALDAFTHQQAVELGSHAIRVKAIAPGPVMTPGASASSMKRAGSRGAHERPIHRLATADEVGSAVVYLASGEAASVTGITLRIDGGITIVGP